MPHLNETDLFLTHAQTLHDAVDAVTRQSKGHVDAPIQLGVNQNVGGRSDMETFSSYCPYRQVVFLQRHAGGVYRPRSNPPRPQVEQAQT